MAIPRMPQECVYSVLLVSASEKFNRSLRALLPEETFVTVVMATDVGAARRLLLGRRFDLLLVNAPLPDEFGDRFAQSVSLDGETGVLLFVKAEQYDEISLSLLRFGVLTLAKPASPHAVSQALRLLCATRERLRAARERNEALEKKMEEVRLVSRAKAALSARYGMTEADAHRYIEKQAMDRCLTRREVAQEILGSD